ncbi:MAG: hypothetical protein PHZ24_05630 [Bacteroidales bacterium]|nr:hypothetical protein [Bacteroidales bacterium]
MRSEELGVGSGELGVGSWEWGVGSGGVKCKKLPADFADERREKSNQ